MKKVESFVLRMLAVLCGIGSLSFLGAYVSDGLNPSMLLCPVLALLCYAALGIEKELQAAQRRDAVRARRARRMRVVKGGKPMRAA